MVKLSPPRRFSEVYGSTLATVQVIVVGFKLALLLTRPFLATYCGKWSPQTGSFSNTQDKLVFDTEEVSIVHKEWPNSTCLMRDVSFGKLVPVICNYLVPAE